MTISEIKEFNILKEKLFKSHSFVQFTKVEQSSKEMKRYNELMIKRQAFFKYLSKGVSKFNN